MINLLRNILFISVLYFFNIDFGQVQEEWITRYNGTSNYDDEVKAMTVDDSDNVYVTGSSYNTGCYNDILTIKYNSSGVMQWKDVYNSPNNSYDIGNSIALDDSGNVYVAGTSSSQFTVIKYSSTGQRRWAAKYGDGVNFQVYGYYIRVFDRNNIYAAGYIYGVSSSSKFILIKFSSTGSILWTALYPNGEYTFSIVTGLALDPFGNIYVTGYSKDTSGTSYYVDYATIKYNSNGSRNWVMRYNGPGNSDDRPFGIDVDASGNVYITGSSMSSQSPGSEDFATVKYNTLGIQKWVKRYNGPINGTDIANCVKSGPGGIVNVSGKSWGNNTGYDYATLKYDSAGAEIWSRRYNGSQAFWDEPASIAVDINNNIYVTGKSATTYNYNDIVTIKYSSIGNQLWQIRYNDSAGFNDYPASLLLGKNGCFYIGGTYEDSNIYGSKNYLVIKYSEPIGIKSISSVIPARFIIYQNYPNPFNPVTIIKFDVPPLSSIGEGQGVRLVIYDVLGKEVAVLINQEYKAGSYEVDWDATNYPSGVYFYVLKAGNIIESKKMILLK